MAALAPAKPLLRGYVHLAAALLAPLAIVHLLLEAGSASAYVGGAILGASLLLLFGTSAAYHLVPWIPRAHGVVQRLDHSMIYVAIAGIYTPFCLQVLSLGWGIPILAVVWSLAFFAIVVRNAWPTAPRWLSIVTYLGMGWLALIAAAELGSELPARALFLVLSGALFYSGGALVYACRWPNPLPRVFGHHEIFHVAVTFATALMYTVVVVDVLPR